VSARTDAPPAVSEEVAAPAIVRVCKRLYVRGLVAGQDGNVSVRLADGTVLVTPSGMSKVDVEADDLVVVDGAGTVLRGRYAPSSELLLHLRIYALRPDVRAVVHAHPPAATGFAVAGRGMMAPVLPEVILQMGSVPLVPYATPGSEVLAATCEPFIRAHNAFLMANHGATTMGATLDVAHQRMESLEHAARILFVAQAVGGGEVQELAARDVSALLELRGGK
jgi:L-fuculose-phosphate aldolase